MGEWGGATAVAVPHPQGPALPQWQPTDTTQHGNNKTIIIMTHTHMTLTGTTATATATGRQIGVAKGLCEASCPTPWSMCVLVWPC